MTLDYFEIDRKISKIVRGDISYIYQNNDGIRSGFLPTSRQIPPTSGQIETLMLLIAPCSILRCRPIGLKPPEYKLNLPIATWCQTGIEQPLGFQEARPTVTLLSRAFFLVFAHFSLTYSVQRRI